MDDKKIYSVFVSGEKSVAITEEAIAELKYILSEDGDISASEIFKIAFYNLVYDFGLDKIPQDYIRQIPPMKRVFAVKDVDNTLFD